MSVIEISDEEISERLRLNHKRMSEPFYDIDNVFAPIDAKWPGDKEGRALLAFVSLADAGEEKIPCMEQMIERLPSMLNEKGYLGKIENDIFEQQLSGHSWLLRGLCAYYESYGGDKISDCINKIVESLYLPLCGKISDYPILGRKEIFGGADGHSAQICDGWILSTDTCCAFMSIDGLSHVYKITADGRILSLLEEMTETFMKIDKREIKAQTHCTLTAARGMMRLFEITKENKFFEYAKSILKLYTDYAMTYAYENYNWWGRPDSWTEPCAIIDSLMLSLEIFKVTGEEKYRQLAARIYHNGFCALQRPNGGAGTQSIVCDSGEKYYFRSFETKQCCTMRLSEGLKYIKENRELLYAETTGNISKNEQGVYCDADIIYALTEGDEKSGLHPLVKYYKLTEEEMRSLVQILVFKEK